MDSPDIKAWLASQLRSRIVERRCRFSARLPTAAELDGIVLLENLCVDVGNLPEHLSLIFEAMLSIEGDRVRFRKESDAIFARIGVDLMPRDATDLMRRLIRAALGREARDDPRPSRRVERFTGPV